MLHQSGEPGPTREREFNRLMSEVISFEAPDGMHRILGINAYGDLHIPVTDPVMGGPGWILVYTFECIECSTLSQETRARCYEEMHARQDIIQSRFPTHDLGFPA